MNVCYHARCCRRARAFANCISEEQGSGSEQSIVHVELQQVSKTFGQGADLISTEARVVLDGRRTFGEFVSHYGFQPIGGDFSARGKFEAFLA